MPEPLTDDQIERLRNIKATAEQVTRSSLGPVDDVFGDAAWAADIALEALAEVVRLLAERSEASALLARCAEAIQGWSGWCEVHELLGELQRWREAKG